jgi:GTP-binding protein HflX
VVDASAADPEAQMDAVRTVLREIGADEVPELVAFNKSDLVGDEVKRLLDRHPGSVALSAETGAGVDGLLDAVGEQLRMLSRTVEMVVPYERGDVVAALHRQGEVLSEDHEDDATRLRVRLPDADVNRFADFLA